ncbi:phosphatase PAP2 family protein [Streptomyces sp. 8N616]|uniref:phosphatase PAP2 family protein n=1 Tax=Streptomyces sp. 8N616 TaxID=3457414 RepID=UPI003FD39DC5
MLDDAHRWERQQVRRIASWDSPWVRHGLPVVESAAERTRLWWGAAALMASLGGPAGRTAAVRGLVSMGVAELLSNTVAKQLVRRRRPPAHLLHHANVQRRPASSSFPSGHTAAATAFATAVARHSPWWGAAVAVPATMVAVERLHTGAHYPSDVTAGTAIGLASTWLTHHTHWLSASLRSNLPSRRCPPA